MKFLRRKFHDVKCASFSQNFDPSPLSHPLSLRHPQHSTGPPDYLDPLLIQTSPIVWPSDVTWLYFIFLGNNELPFLGFKMNNRFCLFSSYLISLFSSTAWWHFIFLLSIQSSQNLFMFNSSRQPLEGALLIWIVLISMRSQIGW